MSGLKSLKKRINNDEFLAVPTDKSSRLSVTTKEEYVASMEPHVANDDIITLEEKKEIEHNLNGHTIQLGRILKIGKKHQHWERVKAALINKGGHVPSLYGLIKDHKARAEGQPHPTRPVCGADESPNGQLSHVLSVIVAAVAGIADEELQTVCRSTEEMLSEIDKVNNSGNTEDTVAVSTDIIGMYPSLIIPVVAKVVAKEFIDSKLDIELDVEELSLYLALTHDRQELVNYGLGDVTHTRVRTRGRRPGITTEEVISRGNNTESKFNKPVRNPAL